MFEADLEKALLLSKLEYEEHKQVLTQWLLLTRSSAQGLTMSAYSEVGPACLNSQKVSSLGLGCNLVLGPGFIP